MTEVAVVGLGKMGQALARRLLGEGLAVTAWNRSAGPGEELAAAGAVVADDLHAVWAPERPVLSFLADDRAVEAVCLEGGLLRAAPAGGLLIEMSTISPRTSARVAAAAAQAGVRYLRAPVSGNPGVLAAGNVGIMVSGERATFDDALELLRTIGAKVSYVGDAEQARTMKLVLNSLIAGITQLLAEAIVLGEANGLERADMLEVMGGSAIASPFIAYKSGPLVARDYAATFTTAMLTKDLDLVGEVAAAAGVTMPVVETVAALTQATVADGLGDVDFMALLVHLQRLCGVPADLAIEQAAIDR